MIHIIGGAGFVGTRLALVLDAQSTAYRIFDKALDGEGYCDVTTPDSLATLPPADIVINLAAEHRDDVTPRSLYDEVNVEGAKNVCDYCRRTTIRQIIFTSSVAVYGFAPEGTAERGAFNPFNDYGRTKMEAETVYREWLAEDPDNRSLIIVRPTVIFGEQNRGNVYNLLRQIARGRFVMFGSGTNRKSMAYVQNVAEFLAFSTQIGPREHVYNYVDKPDLDMNTLVGSCRAVLFGKEGVGLRMPGSLGILAGYGFDMLAALTGKKYPISSIRVKKFMGTTAFSTAISETGFVPSYSLAEGIERTLRHEFLEDHSADKLFYTE
ncbi:NAD-dependent epimerase/dehydratase family protein [Luminiphilus sp. nBUS_07]|uniref:NAD-dependent epimerase/dehydratase family protein n=1 Tax=Luminiphilus sp. nBUS_07 TaxID=3395314 RepID=UPI003EB8E07B